MEKKLPGGNWKDIRESSMKFSRAVPSEAEVERSYGRPKHLNRANMRAAPAAQLGPAVFLLPLWPQTSGPIFFSSVRLTISTNQKGIRI